jgi:neutral ceramidase
MKRNVLKKITAAALCFVLLCGVLPWQGLAADAAAASSGMRVGVGTGDITGPVTEISTGYNSVGDLMKGLLMKLNARAFVVESGSSRVCYVSAEIVHMTESIKPGVIKELNARGLGGRYNVQNVMLAATHCHSSPSNTSWYGLYDLVNGVPGFDDVYYKVVVRGIADAIQAADENLQPGSVSIASGDISGAVANRSFDAYKQNYDADTSADIYTSVNPEMVLLRFNNASGSGIGALNWFGSHGTSNSIDNTLVSADHKGYAAYEMEQQHGDGFVAAFAQSESGDASPNTPQADYHDDFLRPNQLDSSLNVIENEIVAGTKELNEANSLYNSASDLGSAVDYRYTSLDFSNIKVDQKYIGEFYMPWDDVENASTSTPCIGAGIMAGDEEGAPVDSAAEGQVKNTYTQNADGSWTQHKFDFSQLNLYGLQYLMGPLWPTAMKVLNSDSFDAAQAEKVVCLNVGNLMQTVQPLQIFRIGSLVIAGVPFEVTSTQAQRTREALLKTLAQAGVNKVVLSTLTNSYSQYVTTREEYAAQHYEGSTVLFGPWSGDAMTQELDVLAAAMFSGEACSAGKEAPDMSGRMVKTPAAAVGTVKDTGLFGKVVTNAKGSYSMGQTVSVTFQAANPRNVAQLKANGTLAKYCSGGKYSYMEVQTSSDGGKTWQTVRTDADPYTTFTWQRTVGFTSRATVTWLLKDASIQPGLYRLQYNGIAKNLLGCYVPFTGVSRSFTVSK